MILGLISRDNLKRAARTFVIAFLGIAVPGFLGFMKAVTDWASASGQKPFPDAHNLTYLLVSAVSAAMIAVVNVVWVAVEDATGKGLLRTPAPKAVTPPAAPPANQGGYLLIRDLRTVFLMLGALTLLLFAVILTR